MDQQQSLKTIQGTSQEFHTLPGISRFDQEEEQSVNEKLQSYAA